MTEDTSTAYRVVLEGRSVGPYDRRTIVGMRIKKALTNDHVLIGDDGRQLTVGELIARRSHASSGFAVSRNPHSTSLLPTYHVRYVRAVADRGGAFGFRGEGEARLQPDILRLEGERRRFGLFTKRARVKVPLNCIQHAELRDTTVSFSLAPDAPFEPSTRRKRVTIAFESQDAAREMFSFMPDSANAAMPAGPAIAPAAVRNRTPASVAMMVIVLAAYAALAAIGDGSMQPEASLLVSAGSNFGPLTRDGQGWRLFTGLFLHAGVIALLVSLVGLWGIGRTAERAMGMGRFLAVYLGAGVVAGLASLWWNPWTNAAGAIPALIGTACALGIYTVLPGNNVTLKAPARQLMGVAVLLAYWVGYGAWARGMDNAGNVAGLLMGGLCGLALSRPTKWWPEWWRFAGIVGAAIVTVGICVTLWMQTPNRGPALRADIAFSRELDRMLAEQAARTEEARRLVVLARNPNRDGPARDQLVAGLRDSQSYWRNAEDRLRSRRLPGDARLGRVHAAMRSHAAGQQELATLALEGVTYGDTAELQRRASEAGAQARQAAERLKAELDVSNHIRAQVTGTRPARGE